MRIQRTLAAAVAASALFALAVALPASAAVGDISTVAGSGSTGYSGDGGLATLAQFESFYGMSVDGAGNVYIADGGNYVTRRVDHVTGIVTVVAGTGISGYTGDGAAATSADIGDVTDVAVNAAGDLYIADESNSVIRRVDHATGIITTVAGTGTAGYSGDGAAATLAELNAPYGVAVTAAGDLYIADSTNNVIRRVDHATGIITTVAGTGAVGYSGDGAAATDATFDWPMDVVVDAAGDLYINDYDNNVIRRVDHSTGFVSAFAGTGAIGYTGDGAAATDATLGSEPGYLALDGAGNLYIPDYSNYVVRMVDHATGFISTVAGTGASGRSGDAGPALAAALDGPWSVAVDNAGDLFIGEYDGGGVRKVSGLAVAFSLPVTPPVGLPATGASTDSLVWIALAMLAAGAVLVTAQRRTNRVR